LLDAIIVLVFNILSVVVKIVVELGAALALALVVNVKALYLAPHWV